MIGLAGLGLLKRYWPFLAGAVALLTVVLWYRGQLADARQEGYNQAVLEANEAAAAASAAYQQEVEKASKGLAAKRADTKRRTIEEINDVQVVYVDGAGGVCLSAERVREAQASRDRILSAPAG